MSHTLEVKTRFIDPAAIAATCREMGIPEPTARGNVKLYAETVPNSIGVKLPGWQYPLAIQPDGSTKLDNYNGAWGEQKHLDRFSQLYAANKATLTAQKQGLRVTRQTLPNGSLKIVVSGYR